MPQKFRRTMGRLLWAAADGNIISSRHLSPGESIPVVTLIRTDTSAGLTGQFPSAPRNQPAATVAEREGNRTYAGTSKPAQEHAWRERQRGTLVSQVILRGNRWRSLGLPLRLRQSAIAGFS